MPIPGAKNLDKSQRTALIKAVSLALGQRTWDELEAMVGELGLWIPAQDDRLGRASTVEGALSDANDSQLDVLAGIVLSPEFNLDWERLNPWDPGKFRLFLSHAHEDRVFVGAVAASLSGKGIHGFAAHEDIEVHAEWAHVIEYALDTADALVAFVSEPSTSSFWCNQEIGWALGRHLLVASVRLDRAPVGFTSRFQAQRAADPAQLAENLWNFLRVAYPFRHWFARSVRALGAGDRTVCHPDKSHMECRDPKPTRGSGSQQPQAGLCVARISSGQAGLRSARLQT